MKNAYPIVLTQGEKRVIVFVPEFSINTEGTDVADAIEMARDAIGLVGIDMEDDGEKLPDPSPMQTVQKAYPGIVTLVDVDFTEYRRRNDLRSVKKNCTIPSWLNAEAEKAGINFSAIMQAALKKELRLGE